MKVSETTLGGAYLIEPDVYPDKRGLFMETWSYARYIKNNLGNGFVQDNLSDSTKGTLRGLHFQNPHPQGKLVSVLRGEVFDVIVDLRTDSPTFKKWLGVTMSWENKRQLYIPEGFAHGFVVLSDDALFAYKCTDYFHPEAECTLLWNDPELGIEWPVDNPIVSAKDSSGLSISNMPPDKLFTSSTLTTTHRRN